MMINVGGGDSDASIGDDDDDDDNVDDDDDYDDNVGTNICRTNSVWPAENVHI